MHDVMRVINNGHAGTFIASRHIKLLTKGVGYGGWVWIWVWVWVWVWVEGMAWPATHMQTTPPLLRGDWEQAMGHLDPHESEA